MITGRATRLRTKVTRENPDSPIRKKEFSDHVFTHWAIKVVSPPKKETIYSNIIIACTVGGVP